MIYLLYLISAVAIVFLATKASDYVDLLDKKTHLSGAFIGGVMLSAVTSLPELFTSLSSAIMLDAPGLAIGNILGSNLFNVMMLSVTVLVTFKHFTKGFVSPSHAKVTIFVGLMYLVILLNMLGVLSVTFFTVSISSLIIILLYILGVKSMASDGGSEESTNSEEDTSNLTVKQICVRFAIVSVLIVATSFVVSYATDEISEIHGLGAGLAGAIFLGVATSLPELASTVALFRKRSYDIAFGNVVGSNLFNFVILGITDLFYIGQAPLYDFSDPATSGMILFGTIAVPLTLLLIKCKNKVVRFVAPIGIIGCYVGFLLY